MSRFILLTVMMTEELRSHLSSSHFICLFLQEKRIDRVAQAIGPSKRDVLSSNASTTKKNKITAEEREAQREVWSTQNCEARRKVESRKKSSFWCEHTMGDLIRGPKNSPQGNTVGLQTGRAQRPQGPACAVHAVGIH
jgi:hypothetical protein